MDKQYNHSQFEDAIYKKWEEGGGFAPKVDPKLKTFTIIMPPPNANDPLHVGHAMFITIEDILIRYHRMKGEAALWLPGTDHAGIETQFVFEKKLNKNGKSRFDYDREALYKMIWDYVEENSGVAIDQMKKIGASADWSRQKFTLDEDCVDLTLATFERMHGEGLVERKEDLVNYCPFCGTAYSQLEIIHEERTSPLYYLKYGPFELATVRPETKFGDTAVAVNPKDKRYKDYVGEEIEVEGLLGKFNMKVITDDYVDPEFGTGVVKITPAHDLNDFEVWQRHKDEIPGPKQVIGFDGRMTELAGKYAGLKVAEARRQVVEDLKEKGLLVRIDEKYKNSVAICYRCGRDIEPLPLAQFFIRVKPLTNLALETLRKKETVVYGAGHDKILKHWLTNLKDWNISRQIVWGIRQPIWYQIGRNKKQETRNNDIVVGFLDKDKKYVSGKIGKLLDKYSLDEIRDNLQTLTAPTEAEYVVSRKSPGGNYIQETDTFDTWFSSGQWPVNTLKTTNEGDFERFYPTSVMETGYDILPFWVMRMMMLGIYLTGKTPFEKVYLHGLVRDEGGAKMSKSKGNVINPLKVIEKYGADALRMALVMSTTAGKDSNTGENKIRGMRNLTNKIWNAVRYISSKNISSNSETLNTKQLTNFNDQSFQDKINQITETTTKLLDGLKIGLAAETVYNEFWHWYCDEAIENHKTGAISNEVLLKGLVAFLKLLHPFVPFVTEAVWEELRGKGLIENKEMLMNSEWLPK